MTSLIAHTTDCSIRSCFAEEKKVSSMNYSYRLIISEDAEKRILKYRQLLHQYIVDMYMKIETERLQCI